MREIRVDAESIAAPMTSLLRDTAERAPEVLSPSSKIGLPAGPTSCCSSGATVRSSFAAVASAIWHLCLLERATWPSTSLGHEHVCLPGAEVAQGSAPILWSLAQSSSLVLPQSRRGVRALFYSTRHSRGSFQRSCVPLGTSSAPGRDRHQPSARPWRDNSLRV